jgi:hypothetical protein
MTQGALDSFLQEIDVPEYGAGGGEADDGSLDVACPDGVKPGQLLYVTCPDGSEVTVTVPEGVSAGQTFTVTLGGTEALGDGEY